MIQQDTTARANPSEERMRSMVINQPLATVVPHLRAEIGSEEGHTPESDPTFAVMRVAWGRQVDVRYTLYAVPGGVQVTASIECPSHRRLDPVTHMAVRAISRRFAADLSKLRDDLE
jgi:hypothetical protein